VKITRKGFGAATTFGFAEGKVWSQSMTLEGPLDRLLADALPHEVAHTIFANWLNKPMPRWADEGGAVLSEASTSWGHYDRVLWGALDKGRALPLRRLLALREYPTDLGPFYAQSYSVTDFLIRTGGRAKFLAFVSQGDRDGWKRAVKTHYGYPTVEQLERAWLAGVEKDRQNTGRPRRPIRPKAEGQPGEDARLNQKDGELPRSASRPLSPVVARMPPLDQAPPLRSCSRETLRSWQASIGTGP
jgi:hypothetical protein